VPDPVMFQRFLDAADYWFGDSDNSSAGSYDPAWECFVVLANDQANAANAVEASDGEVPPRPGNWTAPGCGAKRSSLLTAEGADINAQLAQARELEAKLAEEYRAVRLLRASIAGEASARGERVRDLGKQARERINTDFDVDNPNTPPRASQKLVAAATLLRAMPAPSTPEARNLQRKAQALMEQAAVQQAESSASRIRQQGSARDDGGAQGPEPSVHAGGVAERPANHGCTPVRERILDTHGQAQDGDARNVINARRTGNAETRATAGYHPRRGGRYDSREDRPPTPEPPGTRVFSRKIRIESFPQRFRQPTSIDRYNRETDPRVWLNDYRLACQPGGATTDEVIIRNLPLHLTNSARTWLEHLPASQIHNWDDMVRTLVGNFQGTYVRPGNSWDLRACTQKPGESLRDFIRHFSKSCTELPSVAQSENCALLPRGHHLPGPRANSDAARPSTRTSCSTSPPASPLAKKRWGRSSTGRKASAWTRPRRAASPKDLQQKHKRGKKGKKPRREAREQGRDDDGDEALAVDPARRDPRAAPRGAGVFDDMLKKPCLYHKTPVNHTLEQCDMLKKYYSHAAAKGGRVQEGRGRWRMSSSSSGDRSWTCPTASASGSGTRSSPWRRRLPSSSTGRRTPSPSAVRITRTASPTRVSTHWWSTRSSGTRGSRRC
jgi:hypothetical protein